MIFLSGRWFYEWDALQPRPVFGVPVADLDAAEKHPDGFIGTINSIKLYLVKPN